MQSQAFGLRVAGTIFGVVCFLQLGRLLFQFDVAIGGFHVPLWASAIAVLITGGISVWLWRLAKLP